jgi:hypothetical protein
MPSVLKELMRHANIETTMKYYVGRNAQSTAATLWAAREVAEGGRNRIDNGLASEQSEAACDNASPCVVSV